MEKILVSVSQELNDVLHVKVLGTMPGTSYKTESQEVLITEETRYGAVNIQSAVCISRHGWGRGADSKGFEQRWTLASTRGPGTNLRKYQRTIKTTRATIHSWNPLLWLKFLTRDYKDFGSCLHVTSVFLSCSPHLGSLHSDSGASLLLPQPC